MTPAVKLVKESGVLFKLHEYHHDSASKSYGEEAATALGIDPAKIFKTLLVSLNGQPSNLAVAVIPVSSQLSLKSIAKALQAKKAEMANPKLAERTTGYLVGGISPLGQKRQLPTVIDQSAKGFNNINVSAGKRGLEIELNPQDLAQLTHAEFAYLTTQ